MISNSEDEKLFTGSIPVSLKRGEVLHDTHDKCSSIGKVLDGKLRLSRILSTGKEIVIKEFIPGELFAELIVFTGEQYPGRITAAEDSRVVEAALPVLLDYLDERNSLIAFITGISNKLTHLTNTIEIMSLKTVEQKIAYYLIVAETKQNPVNPSEITRDRPFSVTDLAEKLGSSREAVSRAISSMTSGGIITKNKDGIQIKNRPLLEDLI